MINKMYKINKDSVIKLSVIKWLSICDLFKLPVPSKLVGVYFINTQCITKYCIRSIWNTFKQY